jgi:hypothetical protein
MVYSEVSLNPTEGQMHDLANGDEVKLSHQHIAGQVPFHLTTAQIKKLMKAHAAGKGATLKFSKAQLKFNFQNGGGIFQDILSKVVEYGKPLARKAAGAAIDYGANKLRGYAGIDQKGSGFLGDAGKWLGHHAVDGLVGMTGLGVGMGRDPDFSSHQGLATGMRPTQGKGVVSDFFGSIGLGVGQKKQKGRKSKQQGEGFFGDAAKWLGHKGVDAIAGALGGSVNPNPLANQNERIASALYSKKMVKASQGQGLW